MKMFAAAAAAAALTLCAAPVSAKVTEADVAEAVAAVPPAAPPTRSATVDPDRLAAALPVAARLWPDGTFRSTAEAMAGTFLDAMVKGEMPMGGNGGKDGPGLDAGDAQAMQRVTGVMMTEMLPYFERAEPAVRAGLARALARRFDVAQLGEIDAFFATPTGAAFAPSLLTLQADPDVIAATMSAIGEVTRDLPAIIERVAPKIEAEVARATPGKRQR